MSPDPGPDRPAADGRRHREVLGHYPTGVALVTTLDDRGRPRGMVVGSFTSLSLDPPLVGFSADRDSWSYQALRDAPRFCVNILSAEQGELCRVFSLRDEDRFRSVDWLPSVGGSPIVDGCVAWIDCATEGVVATGDHDLVIGRVVELEAPNPSLPLLFFRGGYGSFGPRSSVLRPDEPGTQDALAPARAVVDAGRAALEAAAATLGREVIVLAAWDEQMGIIASAGSDHSRSASVVGRRFPLVPPYGSLFVAHRGAGGLDDWLSRLRRPAAAHERDRYDLALERVRRRGWSVAVADPAQVETDRLIEAYTRGPHTPALDEQVRGAIERLGRSYEVDDEDLHADTAVRLLALPIHGADGGVVAAVAVHSLSGPIRGADLAPYGDVLGDAARAMSDPLSAHGHRTPVFPALQEASTRP